MRSVSAEALKNRPLPLIPIIVAQQCVLLPLYFYIPVWIALLNTLVAGVVIYSTKNKRFKVARWLKFVITVLAIVGVYLVFNKISGKDAGISLIAAMYGLKTLETDKTRDANLLLSLSFFILTAGFLFSSSPLIVLYQIVPILAILNAFVTIHSLNTQAVFKKSFVQVLKESGRYLFAGLPIMGILFVFFPRLDGPLWRMPGVSQSASGISDRMSPGEISDLQLSDKVAFRARFDKKEPSSIDLYWRVLTLNEYDGLYWFHTDFSEEAIDSKVVQKNNAGEIKDKKLATYSYQVVLEPTRLNYLVSLDKPVKMPSMGKIKQDYTTQVDYRLMNRTRYHGESIPGLKIEPELSVEQKLRYTQLPSGNPKSRQLATILRLEALNDEAYINQLLSQINQEPYFYTLRPPIMEEDIVDSFWFDKKKGFCEHYAGALVFLARAANIPARVVIGYQGGEKNPLSDSWLVRYSDAHAWTEIWFASKGWIRIDPTAAIANHRIEKSLLNEYRQRDLLFDSLEAIDIEEPGFIKNMSYWADSLSHNWNDWVLDFNSKKQFDLFKKLGISGLNDKQIIMLMLGLVTIFLIILSFKKFRFAVKKESEISQGFRLIQKKIEKQARLKVTGCEGPLQLKQKLIALNDPQHNNLIRVLDEYIRLRYQEKEAELKSINLFLKKTRRIK